MEIADDLIERIGQQEADQVLMAVWERPILKCDAAGIHGTLFYDADERREDGAAGRERSGHAALP